MMTYTDSIEQTPSSLERYLVKRFYVPLVLSTVNIRIGLGKLPHSVASM